MVDAAAGGDGRLLERAQPGRRLARVEHARAGPLERAHASAVAVAIPERWARKFSAVRSPASRARALPDTSSTRAPASRHSPSGPRSTTAACGSSRLKTPSATSSPNTTPAAF